MESGRLGRAAGGGWRDEIQDASAAVALVQPVVAADLVEHLGTKADVADGAETVPRFGDGNAAPPVRDPLEETQCLRRELRDDPVACVSDAGELGLELGALGIERFLLASDFGLFGL